MQSLDRGKEFGQPPNWLQDCAAVLIDVDRLFASNRHLRRGFGSIPYGIAVGSPARERRTAVEQITHSSWIWIVGHRDPSDVPVYEIRDLLFESEHHACCGHDEDECTAETPSTRCVQKRIFESCFFLSEAILNRQLLKSSEIVH